MQVSKSKYSLLKEICNDINALTLDLSGGNIIFFKEISVTVKFTNQELCFNNLISWLYILYHEDSAKNIEFIRKKIHAYNINVSANALISKQLVHAFRTIFQHQIDFLNSKSDSEKINLCHSWFQTTISKQEPVSNEDWETCVDQLLDTAIDMMQSILVCLREIERSEHLDLVIDEWKKVVFRNYSVHDFEKILIKVLSNLGLEGYFDTYTLTKKNYSNWLRDLDVLPDGFNFEFHAYKIVERFILKKETIPIDGNDIISLGVDKGKNVLELLIKAREIFYNNPCNKKELLSALKTIMK